MATLSAQSETDICNQALSLSGNDRIINIGDADDERARVCALLYPRARDEVVGDPDVDWNIASARAQLSELTPVPAFGWAHKFTLPADIVRVRSQVTSSGDEKDIKWEREGDVILTDEPECFLLYIKKVTDPVKFPPILYEAIYTKLAAKLATRLSENPGMASDLLNLYLNDVLPRARSFNSAESFVKGEDGNEDWIDAGR